MRKYLLIAFCFLSLSAFPQDAMDTLKHKPVISLLESGTLLQNITVTAKAGQEFKSFSRLDIKLRAVNNSQEILRLVPGLFIGQHQGGGKAEQIFLRGFDCDHGTDINISTDGLPVNLVSQAHGQGYADMHFIIPETIESVDFQKGPYNASKGDFTTSGFVELNTKTRLNNSMIRIEAGMFDSYRALGMFDLLSEKAKEKQQSLYIATEYAASNGYFDSPQHFHRVNEFIKYTTPIGQHTKLTGSASFFSSKWSASGQIPERAVKEGSIGFFGSIDNTEGGMTNRSNVNIQFITSLKNETLIKNQFYYSRCGLDLHSDFTFFKEDTVNGDQIRQREDRDLFGYTGSYEKKSQLGAVQITSTGGLGFRDDRIYGLELSHTIDRTVLLNRIAYGEAGELNLFAFASETFRLGDRFTVNTGLRADQFYFHYKDHLKKDSLLNAKTGLISPKLSLYYQANPKTKFYIALGKGFHSNDVRVSVFEPARKILPAAYSADIGTILKPAKNILLQAALWYLLLDQEFVYSGDAGYPEPSGKTIRKGFDLSVRYQPLPALYFDMDLNYAHGRFADAPKGNNYIPLAPVWSSTGGLTYKKEKGINGSLRYRWIGDRPGKEDYSLKAKGYMVNDLTVNYTTRKFEWGLTISNLFNVKWKETQFDTESRLRNEPAPVEEIHFTAGTKLAAKLSFSFFF